MSQRIDRSWVVVSSIEGEMGTRCVDIFRRPDGTYGFEEFRRDPEDQGRWTATASFSSLSYPTRQAAEATARAKVAWLAD